MSTVFWAWRSPAASASCDRPARGQLAEQVIRGGTTAVQENQGLYHERAVVLVSLKLLAAARPSLASGIASQVSESIGGCMS